MEAIALALALGLLGFVLGLIVGARRAITLMMTRRTLQAANARTAQFLPGTMPTRSAADILAGRIRIRLGGSTYDVPVLPRGPSKRWLETLDARFAALAVAIDLARDDTPTIMSALVAETDALYDMLLSYDQSGVLPPRADIDELATDNEILQALVEVWRAAHPLAVMPPEGPSLMSWPPSEPASSPPPPMAGSPMTSNPG